MRVAVDIVDLHLNRTIVELKYIQDNINKRYIEDLNRTIVELKLGVLHAIMGAPSDLNRTIVELK